MSAVMVLPDGPIGAPLDPGALRGVLEFRGGEEVGPQLARAVTDLIRDAGAGGHELRVRLAYEFGTESVVPLTMPWTLRADPVSEAEQRVLQYLPTHFNYAAIGAQLGITRSTVKTHAKSIFRKLGVHSRGEAVRVAQQLGLVSAYGL